MDKDRYIGRLLDNRYEILEVIGTGGMAVVYKARCHRLNRLVAIKILKDDYSQDEEFRRRFHAESQSVAMLSHANIVSVYDVSTSDDADYIVMELIDGITLKQYMEKKGVLNWKETLHFAIQISKALDHAHSRGIIHRDIKPHNVMVLKNGSVKVTDFGIARVMSKSNTLTKEALGSVHYISPEQAKGGRVDNRSDIYSLGVVMYEMMTGRPPYDGESPVAVAIQHINGKAQMPSTLNPNIPGGLEQIIMKAMAQEPGGRYASAQAMLYDMDEFRKDPTVLFDYHNTSTGMDDATLIQSSTQVEEIVPQPKTVAERTASRAGETPARRNPQPAQRPRPTAQRPRNRREEIIEEDEKGSKIATIAVVACSVVAIIAIGIFLITLFGNGVEQNQNVVTVPNLINKVYDSLNDTTDYVVEVENRVYSDNYEAGRIMEQNPSANTRIPKGGVVSVVVSLGPEPEEKVMIKLQGEKLELAKNFLTNTQGVSPDRIEVREETNADVKEGLIIRTEPGVGEPLPAEGKIILYVSTGASVKTVVMVDLTADFYTEESAIRWLEMNGFTNYTVAYVKSEMPAGKVLSQTVVAGKTVAVTQPIIILVSEGDEKPIVIPPSATEEPEDYVPKRVTIEIPATMQEDTVLSVYREDVLIEERQIPVGTVSTEFILSGKGVMEFEIVLGKESWTIEVDFDELEE